MRDINITFTSSDAPLYKEVLIREGENLASRLLLNIPSDMLGYQYILVFKINSDTPIVTTEQFPVNGVITYDVTNTLTSKSGELKIELHAYETISVDETRLIKSAKSKLKIIPTLDIATAIEDVDYVPWYTQVLEMYEEVVDIGDHVDTVYDNIVTDEQARVVAEGLRVNAEGNRNTAEGLRVSAEGLRVTAESNRNTAEGIRLISESARNLFVAYNNITTYVVNNKVSYNGSSYVCILESTGNLPTDATYWMLIAQKGVDGVDGTQADWNATEGLAVILNKPTIPTVPSIVNNLTTETTGSTLDATQGKTLNDKIVALNRTPTALKEASYTLALTDEGNIQKCLSASAIVVTIPKSTTVAMPALVEIVIVNYGAGTVTVTPATDVTLNGGAVGIPLSAQYSWVTIKQMATDEWVIMGGI